MTRLPSRSWTERAPGRCRYRRHSRRRNHQRHHDRRARRGRDLVRRRHRRRGRLGRDPQHSGRHGRLWPRCRDRGHRGGDVALAHYHSIGRFQVRCHGQRIAERQRQRRASTPNDVIGTAAVGGIGGEGFTVEVITVHDTVDAHIADSTASGHQGVSVEANGQRTLMRPSSPSEAARGAGIDGAVSVLTLGADLDSTSSGQVIQTQSSVNNSLLNSQGVPASTPRITVRWPSPARSGPSSSQGAQANLFTVSLASGMTPRAGPRPISAPVRR